MARVARSRGDRARIVRLLPGSVRDRPGWAADLHAAFEHLKIPRATETYCATLAVVEQESTFQADPVVPNLPRVVRAEIDRRAEKYHVPAVIVAAALNWAAGKALALDGDLLRHDGDAPSNTPSQVESVLVSLGA